MPRGANLPAIAAFNDTVVLDAIRRSGDGMSRVELVGATGLSAQTVSNVSRRLLGQGLIREAGKQIDGPGKPRTILQLEPRGSYAVGVHLDPTVITCVLLDLEGSVIEHVRRHSPVSGDPAETIAAAVDAIGDVLKRSGVDRSRVSGVGVAAPGPIDVGTGVVVRPPLVPGWNDLHLGDELTAATGLPSLLAKDVTAAAVGERWRDPAGASGNFVFVYYGTGVGVGMVLAGAVYTGASQNAGDVGHAIVDPGPDGALCACGRRGCYGESVRPYRLVMQGIRAGVLRAPGGAPVPDGVDLDLDVDTVDELFTALTRAADNGDAAAALHPGSLDPELGAVPVEPGGPSRHRSRGLRRSIVGAGGAPLPGAAAGAPARDRHEHPDAPGDAGLEFGRRRRGAVGAACLVLDATFAPLSRLTR